MKSYLPLVSCLGLILMLLPLSGMASGPAPVSGRHCVDSRQYLELMPPGEPPTSEPDPSVTFAGPPPGGNHNVGDEWDWYIWNLNGMPWSDLKPCTVRGKGPNVYVVVENDAWDTGLMDQADVDAVVDAFENSNFTTSRTGGIYDLAVDAFGNPPLGLDGDPRVYLLYYDFDVSSDGFFSIFDTDPDGTNPMFQSNECEVLYLNCGTDPGVNHDPSGPYMIGVVAHELEHLIHYAIDPDEESWVDEGLAEFSMYWYGADDPSWIASFLSNPDVALIPPGNIHYGVVWFWTVYFASQYGETALTRSLVQETADGIAGIDSTLASLGHPERFPEVFRDWVVATLIDNPSIGTGRFGYPDYDFAAPTFSASHGSFPVSPTTSGVNLWAADYVRFQGYGSVQVGFDGRDSDSFALRYVELDDDVLLPPRVADVTLDPGETGSIDVDSSSGYESLVLIPAAMSPSAQTASYTYDADAVVGPILLKIVKQRPPADPFTDLELSWVGGAEPFDLYRATDRILIGSPSALFQSGVTTPLMLDGEVDSAYLWVQSQ